METNKIKRIRKLISAPLTALLLLSLGISHSAYGSLFERVIPKGEIHLVSATDRDVAFLIDDYIYDARQFCDIRVGDRVVFFEGRYGLDYRATVYNLEGRARCEVLLRERFIP